MRCVLPAVLLAWAATVDSRGGAPDVSAHTLFRSANAKPSRWLAAQPLRPAAPLRTHASTKANNHVSLPAQDPNTESGRECRDGQDNDGDGTTDCADPDCASSRMCGGGGTGGTGGTRPGQTPEDPNTESGRECRDGQDNDGDGIADCADPDCAASRMCGGGGTGGTGGTRPAQTPEDPNTESGRECRDGQDNDSDGVVDCADPDCAAVTQICGDPTCFTAGSAFTSARCCDTARSAQGDATCWGGGYDFSRCCPRTLPPGADGPPTGGSPTGVTQDCSLRGFAQISTSNCPAPKAGARVPTECPTDCAAAFMAWHTACGADAITTEHEADTALGGGVSAFVALCQAASGH